MITAEQHWAIKFCTKLEKKFAKTHKLLELAYGEPIVRASFKAGEKVQEGVDDNKMLFIASLRGN